MRLAPIEVLTPSLRLMLYALSPVPLLSVGALQDKFTCPQLAAVAVRPVGDVGGTLCATAGALLSTIRTAKSNALPQIWGEQILFFIGIPCFGHDDGVDRTKRDDGRTVPEVHLGRAGFGYSCLRFDEEENLSYHLLALVAGFRSRRVFG